MSAPRNRTLASPAQLLRSAFLMYFVVSLVAAPCADWLAELMRATAGAGDFRDGAIVLESLVDGSIAGLLLPLGFGVLVLAPLAIPLRMIWLTSIFHSDWSLKAQTKHGLQRTPAAFGAYLLLLVLGCCLLTLLGFAAWLVYSSFDGDPNGRNAMLWTSVALLPFVTVATLLLAAFDLSHAGCVQLGPIDSLVKATSRSFRALPTYLVYALICAATLLAGSALNASPWVLLPTLQVLVFIRYLARAFWLKAALARM